jgi:hypothetical protein
MRQRNVLIAFADRLIFGQTGNGEDESMQAFLAGVAAALVIAVVSYFVLDSVQKPSTAVYTSSTGARI